MKKEKRVVVGGVGRGSLSSLCKLFTTIKETRQTRCMGFAFVRPELG
jgi:hypothetical protein